MDGLDPLPEVAEGRRELLQPLRCQVIEKADVIEERFVTGREQVLGDRTAGLRIALDPTKRASLDVADTRVSVMRRFT